MYRFDCGCEFPIIVEAKNPDDMPGLDFDINNIRMDCPATFALLGRGETKGVFQLESQLGKQYTKKLRPEADEHIGALGALLRPGCLKSVDERGVSMTTVYCRRKNGEEPVPQEIEAMDRILRSTYGVLTYQEQAMAIAQSLAGFSLQEADSLRKAIGKKLPEEMAKCKKLFMDGAAKAGIITEEQATTIFGWIQESQRYSFNKCVAGDTIIHRTAKGRYLKSDGFTVERMYRVRNDLAFAKANGHEQLRRKWKRLGNYGKGLSMCDDGRIRPNTIVDIQPAGLRQVLLITLTNGATIRVTDNHKFPTPNGIKTAAELRNDDELYVCGEYEPTDFKEANRFSKRDECGDGCGKVVNGCFGESNVAFTNGSFTEFKKNDLLIPMVCNVDRSHTGRLELHHINGDRANSHISNLERLCSSCHKKAEYRLGRTKRGEKGYPSVLVRIFSIHVDGECETYDVTMAAPNHNFVTGSGIVTCNSHAIAYGIVGYQCAYIKAHFAPVFFSSWLTSAKEDAEPKQEIYELVQDSKLFSLDVQPPDFTQLNADFTTDHKTKVQFGLANISGIGPASLNKIFTAVGEAEQKLGKRIWEFNWVEFLVYVVPKKLSADVMKSLIRTGALRHFGKGRKRMEAEYDAWSVVAGNEKEIAWLQENCQQAKWASVIEAMKAVARVKKEGGGCSTVKRVEKIQSEIQLLENPPSSLADTPNWIAWCEEQLLGISISCSELDGCDLSEVNTTCKDFLAGRDGYMVFGVKVESVREVKTKKGKNPGQKMAHLTISDNSCLLEEVVCFPDAYKEFGSLLTKGSLLIIQGQRGDNGGLQVKKVWPAS